MGGGMAIGSSAASKPSSKAPKDKDSEAADAASAAAARPQFGASTLSLRQLPVLEDAYQEVGKAAVLVPELALSSEPLAVWGGPVLALALASGTGAASANAAAALSSSSLHFFGWSVIDPPEPAVGDKGVSEGAGKNAGASAYSGAARPKGDLPRLQPVSTSASGMPAPSAPGVASGCGVRWNAEGTRLCICTPTNVHLVAALSPRRLAASGAGAASGRKKGGSAGAFVARPASPPLVPAVGVLVELCRVPLVVTDAQWVGATLYVVSAAAQDATGGARVLAVFPPLLDPHLVASGAEPGAAAAAAASAAAAMVRDGQRLVAVVAELQAHLLPAAAPPQLAGAPLPPARRGAGPAGGCAPIAVARSHLLLAHWGGSRSAVSAAPASTAALLPAPPRAGVGVSALSLAHPGLRACAAAALGGAWTDARSSTVAFLQASVFSAQWGARLPLGAHTALAALLAAMGCLPAALMLPGLSAAAGLALALGRRGDAFDCAAAKGFAAIEADMAARYVRRLLRSASDAELLLLAGPDGGEEAAAAAAEGDANVFGPLAQAIAFLQVTAARSGDTSIARDWARITSRVADRGLRELPAT
jgi:hypothetical protein